MANKVAAVEDVAHPVAVVAVVVVAAVVAVVAAAAPRVALMYL